MKNLERWLRITFLIGAGIDALAAVALLAPGLAGPVWGIAASGGGFRFAMNYCASLMAGWTALLLWAALRPLERRFVAVLTAFPVLFGLALSEVVAVATGLVALGKLVPLLVMQHLGMLLFAALYHATRAAGRTRPDRDAGPEYG